MSETSRNGIASSSTVQAKGRNANKQASRSQSLRVRLQRAVSLHALSINVTAVAALLVVFFLHLGSLSLFTRGFLLSRTTLEKRNMCDLASEDCTLPAKFDRAIILLVDALRYDFLFPVDTASANYDPAHHNHLTLPAQLARSSPTHSLLYKGVADPPTTTLQRLKAITTGSLPTFVDAGSNFAGSVVEEDNWLEQANRAGKRIAFMGDDTWLTIFPENIFAANHSFPFDSFNVEDLDTVDEGVNAHILPLLDQPRAESTWDILLAHPLGLDHAGHRVGASHSETTRKLKEMNKLIEKIVNRLADRDLLVVLGDHGMDSKGNHGGDSPEETDAALWLYSKTQLVPSDYLTKKPFQNGDLDLYGLLSTRDHGEEFFVLDGQRHRTISQISLVPTLSLLMGFAIPFNNLGSIIPELFQSDTPGSWLSRGTEKSHGMVEKAMRLNSEQIHGYLKEYAAHPSGSDLAPFASSLSDLFTKATSIRDPEQAFIAYRDFTYTTFDQTRAIWAKFDPVAMTAGILTLTGSLAALMHLFKLSREEGCLWKTGPVRRALSKAIVGCIFGLLTGLLVVGGQFLFNLHLLPMSQMTLFSACLGAEIGVLLERSTSRGRAPLESSNGERLGIIVALLHVAIFASNSYILWEDRGVLFLFQLPHFYMLLQSIRTKQTNLRRRLFGYGLLSMIIVRIMAFSTICREEQHPYCKATFYGSSGTSVSSATMVRAAVIVATTLPSVIARFLDVSKSRNGWAPWFLRYSFRALLLASSLYWLADYFEHTGASGWLSAIMTFKITIARTIMMLSILLGTTVWYTSPLCIQVLQREVTDQAGKKTSQVTVVGFANSVGSSYLLFFTTIFSIIFLLAQPVGQIVLGAGFVCLLAFVEADDTYRDIQRLRRPPGTQGLQDILASPPSIPSIVIVVLLGFILFFATGHQAVLSAIQWKTAFIGFPKLTYPISPILVVLNTLGPFILSAAALPLLVFWNVSPSLKNGPTIPLLSNLINACLGFLVYHTALTLSSAIFAAHLRRHLMVWKVFAPRFMLSAITLLAVDITVIVMSVGWGGIGTLKKLHKTFGTAWS